MAKCLYYIRKLREPVNIAKQLTNMNRDTVYHLLPTWRSANSPSQLATSTIRLKEPLTHLL